MRSLAVILAAGLALAACGEAPRPASEPRVKLTLTLPDDGGMVRADRVEVRGTVTPADAAVHVAGDAADVEGGEFRAEIPLDPGGNVIDVTASAPGRRPATDAVRVMRDMRVEVPKLAGLDLDAAVEALDRLELETTEERGGSWLDRVIPGRVLVCASVPAAGELVQPRTTITLQTARAC